MEKSVETLDQLTNRLSADSFSSVQPQRDTLPVQEEKFLVCAENKLALFEAQEADVVWYSSEVTYEDKHDVPQIKETVCVFKTMHETLTNITTSKEY